MSEHFDKESCWSVFQSLTLDQQKDIVHRFLLMGFMCVLSDYFKNSGKDKSNV